MFQQIPRRGRQVRRHRQLTGELAALVAGALTLVFARPAAAVCQPASVQAIRVVFSSNCPTLPEGAKVKFQVLGQAKDATLKGQVWEAKMDAPPFELCRDTVVVTVDGVPVFCEKHGQLNDGWATYAVQCEELSWIVRIEASPKMYFSVRFPGRRPPRNCQQSSDSRTPGSVCCLADEEIVTLDLKDSYRRALAPVAFDRAVLADGVWNVPKEKLKLKEPDKPSKPALDFVEHAPFDASKLKVTLSEPEKKQ